MSGATRGPTTSAGSARSSTLKDEGLVRAIGISINRWQPANVLRALDTGLIDAVQVVYNVFDQNPEDELFPSCREHGIAVIARVPFDEGSLTGTLTARVDAGPTATSATSTSAREPRADARAGRAAAGRRSRRDDACRSWRSGTSCSTRRLDGHPRDAQAAHVEQNMAASDGQPLPAALMAELKTPSVGSDRGLLE